MLHVDAAAAPSSIGGIPNTSMRKEAAKHVILAVARETADSVLWWKDWYDKLPRAFNINQQQLL